MDIGHGYSGGPREDVRTILSDRLNGNFVASVAAGLVLVALSWRPIFDAAGRVPDALIVTALLYAMIVVSYLTYSHAAVPLTHLWGIRIIHGIMLVFGFSAARACPQ